jgi:oligopeptide/dipeptide ABC transporter ATP-binding protein
VSFSLSRGESIGIVGESGSGKSTLALALLGLLPKSAETAGSVRLSGGELLGASAAQLNKVRGRKIGFVYQDALVSLNPVRSVGSQISEVIRRHRLGVTKAETRELAIDAMRRVGIPEGSRRYRQYPHEFSGGMRQRVAIAMSLAAGPELLIADEVTTAIDVTVKAQILDLLADLRESDGMALVTISHDLEAVRRVSDRIAVMYAGRILELGPTDAVLAAPHHPYTAALVDCAPTVDRPIISFIPGSPPTTGALTPGCAFCERCSIAGGRSICSADRPPIRPSGEGRQVACHFPLVDASASPRNQLQHT